MFFIRNSSQIQVENPMDSSLQEYVITANLYKMENKFFGREIKLSLKTMFHLTLKETFTRLFICQTNLISRNKDFKHLKPAILGKMWIQMFTVGKMIFKTF